MEKICKSFMNCKEKKALQFEKDGYSILECEKCGHRSTKILNIEKHIKKVYSDDYFFAGKQGYPNYLDEKDLLLQQGINYSEIVARYATVGKVLDVGCAAGFILKGFEQAGWKCHGLEPNERMADYGRDELQLNITSGNLETFESNEKFDLINMIQVIGHFVDLDKALTNVSGLLKPNGMVLVESWNMKSKMAGMMGKHWHEYSPPSVINWFSGKTLAQLFSYHGFELVTTGAPVKKISLKHGISAFDESTPGFVFKKGLVELLSRATSKFNITYPFRDLDWYLFKKL